MIVIILGFVIFVSLAFVGVAFLFPEWVGIQGKLAQQIEADHRGEAVDSPRGQPNNPENLVSDHSKLSQQGEHGEASRTDRIQEIKKGTKSGDPI